MNKDYVTRNEFNTQISKTERAKIIFDIDGGNPLDWNMSGGIVNGTTVSGKDFSKGKKLRCYLRCGSQFPIVEVDLTTPSRLVADMSYNGTMSAYYVEGLGNLIVSINVSLDKTSLSLTAKYSSQTYSDFIIYKIEEVS